MTSEIAPSSQPQRKRLIVLATVVALTVVGFYLRYRCLGCLGFRWDEDLTALAVKALVEKSIPELPSGMIYLRFYPLQWLMAGSVKLFGFSEFSLRLPVVLIGAILIPLSFHLTRKIFGAIPALIVATAVALSFNEVEMARTARMYSPFFVAYLLAAYCIYGAYFKNSARLFSPGALLLVIFALTLHQLAYSLALLLLLAIPLNPTIKRTASLVGQAGLIGVLFLLTKSIQERFFYRAAEIPKVPELAVDAKADAVSVLDTILQQVSLPNFDLGIGVLQSSPGIAAALLLAGLMVSGWSLIAARQAGIAYKVTATASLVFSMAHQFNLAFIALVLLLIIQRDGIRHIRDESWFKPAIGSAVIFLAWLVIVVTQAVNIDSGSPDTVATTRKLLRALVDYPNFRLFWSFALEYPVLIVPLGLGTLWGVDLLARKKPDPAALFVAGGFWVVLFVNSLLKTQYEFFRYNLHLDWFFLVLVTLGILKLPQILERLNLRAPNAGDSRGLSRPSIVAALTVVTISVNPAAATLTSDRGYLESGSMYRFLGLDSYPDFATPAAYVRSRLAPDDRIFVIDPREYWNYIGRVDFWIWTDNYQSQTFRSNGQDLDLYIGVPVLHDVESIQREITGVKYGAAWIIYSKSRLEHTPWLSDPVKTYLTGFGNEIVYTGRDDDTVVIHLQPANLN